MTSFDLTNRIALITGASRGIGRAAAGALAEHGAHVLLVSRKSEGLEAAAEEIRQGGGRAEALVCHVGDLAAIEGLCTAVKDQFGRLDILVNNAATNPHFGELTTVDEGIWNKTLEVNLKGPFFLIRHCVPLMRAAGRGAIVNVSSVNGIRPAVHQGLYSITKGALITMTQAYAKELAPYGIRVNALLPGLTDTKLSSALLQNEGLYRQFVQQVPLGRHADPEEMAGAVLYLVSDAASYTTGACLTCDGGLLA